MGRQRMRPTRNRPAPGAPEPATAPRPTARAPKAQWRETVDSFGGIWTIAIIAAAVLLVVALVITSRPKNSVATISKDALMGDAITNSPANHITDPALLEVPKGTPPSGGPHFPVPQATGVYTGPIPDSNVIHSLEHGIVWISYNPQKTDADTVKKLTSIANSYYIDTILSPRPDNNAAIALVSWGRLLQLDKLDEATVKRFIEINRNRSPEPGIRDVAPMPQGSGQR